MFRPLVLLALVVCFSLPAAADPSQPKVDETALIAWAAGTVTQALTFDFEDCKKVLDHAKHNFSPEGWQALQATLQQSGLQENVTKYQQTVYTQPDTRSAPKIESQTVKDGIPEWTISVPVIQTVVVGHKKATRHVTITMTVAEGAPFLLTPTLAVVQWVENVPPVPHANVEIRCGDQLMKDGNVVSYVYKPGTSPCDKPPSPAPAPATANLEWSNPTLSLPQPPGSHRVPVLSQEECKDALTDREYTQEMASQGKKPSVNVFGLMCAKGGVSSML